jgi:microcystin-dependent protein
MDGYYGEIKLFGGNFAPEYWKFCDGALLQIGANSALFSLIGTTYGGDGIRTFALPDLRDREPVQKESGRSGPRHIICVEGIYPPRT